MLVDGAWARLVVGLKRRIAAYVGGVALLSKYLLVAILLRGDGHSLARLGDNLTLLGLWGLDYCCRLLRLLEGCVLLRVDVLGLDVEVVAIGKARCNDNELKLIVSQRGTRSCTAWQRRVIAIAKWLSWRMGRGLLAQAVL